MAPATGLARQKAALVQLRSKLVVTLGSDSVDVILRRSVAEVSQAYPMMSLLRWDDEQIQFHALENELETKTNDEINDAFNALSAVMLLIIARLLGREIALRLADGMSAEALLHGGA